MFSHKKAIRNHLSFSIYQLSLAVAYFYESNNH